MTCEVPDGPTQDLNVMTRRGRCSVKLEIFELLGSTTQPIKPSGPHLLIVINGDVGVSDATSSEQRRLQRFDSIYIENEAQVVVDGAGMVASISIDPVVVTPT